MRSVGYSELFSLSREDVLAAMKDYPEAQEILQALGRKRLMEVKASARHPPHHKDHHHHGGHHAGDSNKGLVDKIKNEAKVSYVVKVHVCHVDYLFSHSYFFIKCNVFMYRSSSVHRNLRVNSKNYLRPSFA